eukprot:1039488-Pyramimonas_sp.AAC.1
MWPLRPARRSRTAARGRCGTPPRRPRRPSRPWRALLQVPPAQGASRIRPKTERKTGGTFGQ